jgi:hypothetical protein
LTSVIIPNGVRTIGVGAFVQNRLTNVSIPNSVTYIGNIAFQRNQLTNIIIPESVRSISQDAFSGNPLISISIGTNVTLATGGYISFDRSFDNLYNNNKIAGTYTRPDTQSSTWTKMDSRSFPSLFIGTWKRDNFNNTLTFSTNVIRADNQITGFNLIGISGDSYTIEQIDYLLNKATFIIRIVNGNLIISGDSGSGEDNWDGTWIKQ